MQYCKIISGTHLKKVMCMWESHKKSLSKSVIGDALNDVCKITNDPEFLRIYSNTWK